MARCECAETFSTRLRFFPSIVLARNPINFRNNSMPSSVTALPRDRQRCQSRDRHANPALPRRSHELPCAKISHDLKSQPIVLNLRLLPTSECGAVIPHFSLLVISRTCSFAHGSVTVLGPHVYAVIRLEVVMIGAFFYGIIFLEHCLKLIADASPLPGDSFLWNA